MTGPPPVGDAVEGGGTRQNLSTPHSNSTPTAHVRSDTTTRRNLPCR